jgi:tetratricopeptide (TPR) repeat protein
MKQFGLILISLLLSTLILSAQDSTLAKAQQLVSAGDYFGALSLLGPYVKSNPKDAEGFYWRGYTYARLEQFPMAKTNLLTAVKFNPKYHEALAALAYVFAETKQFPESIKAYDKAIDLWKFNAEYFNNRGKVKYLLQKYQAAFFDFDAAIRIDSTYAIAYNNRGSARYSNNIEKTTFEELTRAEADFNQCISLSPNFQIAWRNRGLVRYYLGNFNDAYKDLRQSVQMNPQDAIAHYQLGRVYHKLQQYPMAMEAYNKALALNSKMADVYIDRGQTFQELKDFGNARLDFEQALTLKPSARADIHYLLAQLYAVEEKKELMLQQLKLAQKSGKFKLYSERLELKTNPVFIPYKSETEFQKWYSKVMSLK